MDLEQLKRAGINPLLFNRPVLAVRNEPQEEIEPIKSPEPVTKKRYRIARSANKTVGKFAHKDLLLTPPFPGEYHSAFTDPESKNLINLSKKLQASQIDKFSYETRNFIATSFLTTIRIFEQSTDGKCYREVKRIPNRFIAISPRIITSFHIKDSRIYLAYLWGNANNSRKPYIEVRGLDGTLLNGPIYYDHPVKEIYSDASFIYIRTPETIHIHRKDLFCIQYNYRYNQNLRPLTDYPLVGAWFDSPNFNSYTKLPMIIATTKQILTVKYDVIKCSKSYPSIYQCFRYPDTTTLLAIEKVDLHYFIHRENDNNSNLDLCHIAYEDDEREGGFSFVIDTTFSFSNKLIEARSHQDKIYVLWFHYGFSEIGCINITDRKAHWTHILEGEFDHLVVQDNHLVLLNGHQSIQVVSTVPTTRSVLCEECDMVFVNSKSRTIHLSNGHQSVFTGLTVSTNKFIKSLA